MNEDENENEKQEMPIQWKVHAPNLLKEIGNNSPSNGVLSWPLMILLRLLADIAQRAVELEDPVLDSLMCRLTLYSASDPESEDYNHELVELCHKRAESYRRNRSKPKKKG